MSTDIVISEVPTRSYTVPASFSNDIGERVHIDKIYDQLSSDNSEAREWASRVIETFERSRVKQEQVVLASIKYDDEQYNYIGLTASADDDLIFALVRISKNDTNIENAELLSENQSWRRISDDLSDSNSIAGVAMDAPLVAFTASSFAEGCRGVYLAYGEPLMFLDETPILSTTALIAAANEPDGLIYAIVDGTDTTAVMDVIMITKGPEVYRRDGGAWALDTAVLDSLMSVNPPPLVELSGSTATSVLAQIDSSVANQVMPVGDGTGEDGINPVTTDAARQSTAAPTPPAQNQNQSSTPSTDTYSSNQNKSQLKDGSTAQTAALLARYDDIEVITASVRKLWCEIENESLDSIHAKQQILTEASKARRSLLVREAHLQNIFIPALTADAQSVHDATPNQRKATHLRKYWVRGKGAVKIRWGTPGDFTRCERQLRKYLGDRAKGYCAKRHKETMGFWPGDKRNTGVSEGADVPVVAAGPRIVRTAAGAKKYGQPIGSKIVKDAVTQIDRAQLPSVEKPALPTLSSNSSLISTPKAFISGKHVVLGDINKSAKKGDPDHTQVKVSFADGHIPTNGDAVFDSLGRRGEVVETYQAYTKVKWTDGTSKVVNNKKLNVQDAVEKTSSAVNESIESESKLHTTNVKSETKLEREIKLESESEIKVESEPESESDIKSEPESESESESKSENLESEFKSSINDLNLSSLLDDHDAVELAKIFAFSKTHSYIDFKEQYKANDKRREELLKTVKDVDQSRILASLYAYLEDSLKHSQISEQESIKQSSKAVSEFVAESRPAIRISYQNLLKVAESKRFKTVHETSTSGAGSKVSQDYVYERNRHEKAWFGEQQSIIYGYWLHNSQKATETQTQVAQYGQATVVLKDSVRSRSTYTAEDSLDSSNKVWPNSQYAGNPSMYIHLEMSSSDEYKEYLKNRKTNYVEAQIFDGITLDDIEKIVLPKKQHKKIKETFEALGISVEVEK